MKRRILAAFAAALGTLAVAGPALSTSGGANGRILYNQQVNGPQPSCGDTITVSTKLVTDLVNCPNN